MLIPTSTHALRYPVRSPERRVHPRLRVLVADDHADTRDMFRIYLETIGIEVRLAPDGAAAVQLAHNCLPDVIVLDVRMPKVSGHEAVRLLRADKTTARIPIILLTGAVDDANSQALAGSVEAAVTKPCAPADLAGIIRRVTGRA
jgi:two-component system, OmpR family, response regulator MtrA